MIIKLELTYDAEKSTLSFNFSSAIGQHASGRILFGSHHD